MKKNSIEYVKKYFLDYNCELLDNEYTNNVSLLNFKCKCGSISKISFNKFIKSKQCSGCGLKQRPQNNIKDEQIIKNNIEKFNCVLLSNYNGAKTKLLIRCKCNNNFYKEYNNFLRNPYCQECGKKAHRNKLIGKIKRIDKENYINERKISHFISCTLRRFLKSTRSTKKITDLFGYGPIEFQKYLNNNYTLTDKFTIDHIFPLKAFYEHNIYDLKIMNNLSNIQILSHSDNSKKSKIYNKKDFYNWLDSMGYKNYERSE